MPTGVGESAGIDVGPERLGDVAEATEFGYEEASVEGFWSAVLTAPELGDDAICEDVEASVEGFGSAVLTAPELGDDAICEDVEASVEGFGSVSTTRPTSPCSKIKSGPLQHPAKLAEDPSCAPQHQWLAKEPLFKGQGYRLLKLLVAAVKVSARSLCKVNNWYMVGWLRTISTLRSAIG